MASLPRPLIALLIGTVAFFALWMTALKGGGGSGNGLSSNNISSYQSDIAKAKAAANGQLSTATTSTAPAATKSAPAATTTTQKATPAAKPAGPTAASKQRLHEVNAALAAKKVLAVLFYNPAAADDQAVRQELAAVPSYHGEVVKLAVPIGELASYSVVTRQVPVAQAPTLVLIDPTHQASTIVGFADRFEIRQRVVDAILAG